MGVFENPTEYEILDFVQKTGEKIMQNAEKMEKQSLKSVDDLQEICKYVTIQRTLGKYFLKIKRGILNEEENFKFSACISTCIWKFI